MKKWARPTMSLLTTQMLKSNILVNAQTCIRFFIR